MVNLLSSRFLLLLLIQIGLFAAMFMFMPNRHNRFVASIPGAVFAGLGWQLFSYFFSIYVRHFSGLSTIYGSLTTMAIAMLWLYTCIAIIFYGGALNKYLADIGYELHLRKKQREQPEEQ